MRKMNALNMNKSIILAVIVIFSLILLHAPLTYLFANIFSLMRNDNKCILDEEMYKSKIISLEKQIASYDEAYESLRIYEGKSYVLAKVAFREIYDFFNYITINTDTLVEKGNPVINENGLVGIISEVSGTSAKVNLLTNYKGISVKVGNSYGLIDIYNKKDNTILIKNINNYEKISEGDEVVTSGLTDIVGDIKVGKVVKIEESDIEKLVYVSPYVDFNNINYLYVIKK